MFSSWCFTCRQEYSGWSGSQAHCRRVCWIEVLSLFIPVCVSASPLHWLPSPQPHQDHVWPPVCSLFSSYATSQQHLTQWPTLSSLKHFPRLPIETPESPFFFFPFFPMSLITPQPAMGVPGSPLRVPFPPMPCFLLGMTSPGAHGP